MKINHYAIITMSLIAIFSLNGYSQGWMQTYGTINNDEGNCVIQAYDGGYIITGSTEPWNSDLYLIKTDNSGNTLWTKTYGGDGNDEGIDVKQTTDNGYIIVGINSSAGAGNYDVWLLKTNSEGDTLWTNRYGGYYNEFGNSVFQTDDGGYVIMGSTESFGAGASDFWILRTDADGDSLWSKTYGGLYHDIASEAQATSDGGFILVGYTQLQGFMDNYLWLLKLFSNGEIEWSQTYGGSLAIVPTSVYETADAGFIITGGPPDLFLIKTDMYGDTLWNKSFGGTRNDAGHSVIETAEGDFVVCGFTSSFSADGDFDLWLVKTDFSGDTLWTNTYGGTEAEVGFSVIETFDGGLTVCGSTSSYGAGDKDVWLLHTNLNGTVGIEDKSYEIPKDFELYQNYPNPFNPSTTIKYKISENSSVILKVYDVLGTEIKTLVNQKQPAGNYEVTFNANELTSGVYLYRLHTELFSLTKKMLYLK